MTPQPPTGEVEREAARKLISDCFLVPEIETAEDASSYLAKMVVKLQAKLTAAEHQATATDVALNNLGVANVSQDGRLLTLPERFECLGLDIHKLKVALRESNHQVEALGATMNLLGMCDEELDEAPLPFNGQESMSLDECAQNDLCRICGFTMAGQASDIRVDDGVITECAHDGCKRAEFAEHQATLATELLRELVTMVRGECPSLLNEDSGGSAHLAMRIEAALELKGENDV